MHCVRRVGERWRRREVLEVECRVGWRVVRRGKEGRRRRREEGQVAWNIVGEGDVV